MFNVLQQNDLPRPWENHEVTVCIPHLDTPEVLSLAVRLWQLQNVRPFFLIVDSGSRSPESIEFLEKLARESDIEVARLGIVSDVEHRSDRVAIAMDYAFSRCPTEYLLAAHVDLFPKHRDLISRLLRLCDRATPVVGWEMSPRGPGPDGVTNGTFSDGCPGHACTMFHMPTMDRIGAGWSMRRAHNSFGLPRSYTEVHGWPDTEICLGKILAAEGIDPLFLGRETNGETQETEDWVHARSATAELLLHGRPLERQSIAFAAARGRIAEWLLNDARKERALDQQHLEHERQTRHDRADEPICGLPHCHSRRILRERTDVWFCAHPSHHSRENLVTREMCAICRYWQQAAPDRFRPFVPVPRRQAGSIWYGTVGIAVVCREETSDSLLRDTLDCALVQSYPAHEIVVLDMPQVTEWEVVLKDYADERLRRIGGPIAGEMAIAAVCLESMDSEAICFVYAGDLIDSRFLEQGLREFQVRNVGAVGAAVETFGDRNDLLPTSVEAVHESNAARGGPPPGILISRKFVRHPDAVQNSPSANGRSGQDPGISPRWVPLSGAIIRKQLGIYHRRAVGTCSHFADHEPALESPKVAF